MKKACYIILALAVIVVLDPAPALAQHEDPRGFIGLGVGPSAPFGSFADTVMVNARAGSATVGYTSTMLSLAYRFGSRFGVAAALSYSEYVMRNGGDDDWWQVAGLTVGPMYSHRVNRRTALDLKAMLGLIALTPVVDNYTTSNGTGGGLGLDVRGALRYDAFRRWAVFAEAGLQLANVSFDAGVSKDVRAMISGFGIAFRPRW